MYTSVKTGIKEISYNFNLVFYFLPINSIRDGKRHAVKPILSLSCKFIVS